MNYPILKRGDNGKDVEALQSLINKTGAMLSIDGDFGPATLRGVKYAQNIAKQEETGVVESMLWKWAEKYPTPSELLHTNGIAYIAKEETGGLSYYEKITRWPHFPGYASGITIGVGYDLRFNSESNFIETWENYLSEDSMNELLKDIGKKGNKKRARELKQKGVEVPFKYAWPVFVQNILPKYYDNTKLIYPSLEKLPDLCRSSLVSLVFNRGASLKGSSRREMRNIQKILELADSKDLDMNERNSYLQSIEDEILSMKRLWASSSGLIKRRQSEANMWRQGLKLFKESILDDYIEKSKNKNGPKLLE